MPIAYYYAREITRDPGFGESETFRGWFSSSFGSLPRLTPVFLRGVKVFVPFQFSDVNPQWNV